MTDPTVINGVRVGPNSPLLKTVKHAKAKHLKAVENSLLYGNPHGPELGQTPVGVLAGSVDPIDPAGRMNSWERARAEQLEGMKQDGAIIAWRFEEVTVRLADRTAYTPDFLIVDALPFAGASAFILEEIKGFWREDARIKIKVAARQHPWFRFRALTRPKGTRGWKIEEINR